MSTRLVNLVADAADPAASAGEPGLPLVFVPVPDHKSVPNRVYLDLASPSSAAASAALVDRLVDVLSPR